MMISGNIIDGCRSDNDGGGIAILTTTGDGIGKITLAGNEICNNISSERGGGLYLVQDKPDTIDLQSGIIPETVQPGEAELTIRYTVRKH